MNTSRILKMALRAGLWTVALAAIIFVSFLGIAEILSLLRGYPAFGSENFFLALVCTVIAWIFVAVFHFGKETIHVPMTHPASFLANVRRVLTEMGYDITRQTDDSLGTKRGFQFLLLARGIQIKCSERQARITGPKVWVDALRRRLRVHNFLAGSELHDSQRMDGPFLKRVQISMRVQADNLDEVARHVLETLAQEADVICEVSVLAQSDIGINESLVEQQIRPWLNERGIKAEIHKDLVKTTDPASTIVLPGNARRKAAAGNS